MLKKTRIMLFLVVLLSVPIVAAVDYPYLNGERVTDGANKIAPEYKQKILDEIARIEQNTTAQIAVLTVETLDGDDIDNFAAKTFEINGIGQKDKDNGVLVVIVANERKWRIEVGYGLEENLTDATAKIIAKRYLTPQLKEDNWGAGLYDTVVHIGAVIGGDETSETSSDAGDEIPAWLIILAVIGIIILLIIILLWLEDNGGGGGGLFVAGDSGDGGSDGFGGGGSGGGGASGGF